MSESIFIVYVERDPDVWVDEATLFVGAYAERWQADLHAAKIGACVVEVPIKSY